MLESLCQRSGENLGTKMKLSVLAILLLLASSTAAMDFEKGSEAYESGDYAKALAEFMPLAEMGYPPAQANVALMYLEGRGVLQDYAEALKWYRAAAEFGYPNAQHALGFMYGQGKGVDKDPSEGVKWYRKAVDQGYVSAMKNLGVAYAQGDGVPQDYVLAYKWFNIAAASSHPNASAARDAVASELTPEQIMVAQKLSREWMDQNIE